MSSPPAMTEERLREIDARWQHDAQSLRGACADVPDLIAEVRRLRSEYDGLRESHDHAVLAESRLKEAQDLLLERARQADELLKERDASHLALRKAIDVMDRLDKFVKWAAHIEWRDEGYRKFLDQYNAVRDFGDDEEANAVEIVRVHRWIAEAAKKLKAAQTAFLTAFHKAVSSVAEEVVPAGVLEAKLKAESDLHTAASYYGDALDALEKLEAQR